MLQAFAQGGLIAVIGGACSYFALLWIAPEVPISDFASLVGLVALGSGGAGHVLLSARRKRQGQEQREP